MNDQEIIAAIKKGGELLEEYRRVILPAAEELARRKSLAVFGVEGRYRGDLGCHDSGISEICLHIVGDGRYEWDSPEDKKAEAFEREWSKAMSLGGVKEVYLSGHY